MPYAVRFSPSAERQFKGLPRHLQARLRTRIDALADDPRPQGAERLAGAGEFLRLRVGDYRVIYEVDDDVLIVLVVKVGHRKDVYRRLPGPG